MTVADDALVAVRGLQIGMLGEKVRDLGLDRPGEKGTCPVAQDFCELIGDVSWLNQLEGCRNEKWASQGAPMSIPKRMG